MGTHKIIVGGLALLVSIAFAFKKAPEGEESSDAVRTDLSFWGFFLVSQIIFWS